MYPSDYGYATSGGSTTNRVSCLAKELYNWDSISDCYNNDWLYKRETYQWTLTPFSDGLSTLFSVYSSGCIHYRHANSLDYAASPTLYLSSNVKISGGSGEKSDPFTLNL